MACTTNGGQKSRLAYRLRYRVAREMMPDAVLAQYGFEPNAMADPKSFKFRIGVEGVRQAAALGMFDDLDAIAPVFYLLWGPTDPAFGTIPAYTRLGLETWSGLQRSDGTEIELFPLLSLRVFNGMSRHHHELAIDIDPGLERTLRPQIEIIRAAGVERFGIWSARPQFTYLDNPNGRTMMEVLEVALR